MDAQLRRCAKQACREFAFRAMGRMSLVCRAWRDELRAHLQQLPVELAAELQSLLRAQAQSEYGKAARAACASWNELPVSRWPAAIKEVISFAMPPDGCEQTLTLA